MLIIHWSATRLAGFVAPLPNSLGLTTIGHSTWWLSLGSNVLSLVAGSSARRQECLSSWHTPGGRLL
jgi:hypothetical protein